MFADSFSRIYDIMNGFPVNCQESKNSNLFVRQPANTIKIICSFHTLEVCVVLGWMISLGLNQGSLDFSLKCLRVSCYTTSPFAFLLLFLTLLFSLSLCASPFVPLPPFFLFLLFSASASASRRETDAKENKSSLEELVGFYSRHSTYNPFPQPIKMPLGGPLSFFL